MANWILIAIILCISGIWGVFKPQNTTAPSVKGTSAGITFGSLVPTRGSVLPTPFPPMTLETIFSSEHSWINSLPPGRTVTLIATGDVIPARSVNWQMVKSGNFRWPFDKTGNILGSPDITVINMESPLVTGCKPTVEGMSFCGDPHAIEGFTYAGIDVATLANNHIGNYGGPGIEETKKILEQAGLLTVRDGAAYKDVKNTRFAFLAYDDIGAVVDEKDLENDIKLASKQADVIIVSFHWGTEYTSVPSQRQRYLAHKAIDAGADVIVGNHPHWIQPVELYNGKFITYAHGNFIFDQMWSEKTREGVIGRYVFFDKKLIDVAFTPIHIEDYGQPGLVSDGEATRILGEMKAESRKLQLR